MDYRVSNPHFKNVDRRYKNMKNWLYKNYKLKYNILYNTPKLLKNIIR